VTRVALRDGALNLYVFVSGNGPPLLWVAGLGDDHASWSGVIDRFEPEFTCIALDNRGCGQSDTPTGPYTIKEMAEDIHLLLAALDVGPVAAIGSSMGGAICQEWAAAYPSEVTALVLTNSWAATDSSTALLFDHWIALASSGDAHRLAESLVLFSLSGEFLASSDVASYLTPIANLPGFAASASACRGHDALDRLGGLSAPTLVIAGAHDALTRPALSLQLVNAVGNAQMEVIEAGHMVFWEQPDDFSERVRRFLQQAAAPRR
jgi:pimeloyl-ACP methyl ester carboxylesterase